MLSHVAVVLPRTEFLETVGAVLKTRLGEIMVVSAYIPSGERFPAGEMKKVMRTHPNTILMGDLNAKSREWNSYAENTYGRTLSGLANSEHWDVLGPTQPTICQAGCRSDVIDIAVTNCFQLNSEIDAMTNTSSDHNLICLVIDNRLTMKPINAKMRTNWAQFYMFLDRKHREVQPCASCFELDRMDPVTVLRHLGGPKHGISRSNQTSQ